MVLMMVNYPNWKSLVEPTATGIFMGIHWLIMVVMVNHYGNFNHNWLVVDDSSLKNDGVKVSWDDDIPS